MTTFIDKTRETTEEKEFKKTEFVKYIKNNGKTTDTNLEPKDFVNVELIDRKHGKQEFDLFLAYDNKEDFTIRYLGHAGDEFN